VTRAAGVIYGKVIHNNPTCVCCIHVLLTGDLDERLDCG